MLYVGRVRCSSMLSKLLKRLPLKYIDMVNDFYSESDLGDGCKYVLEVNSPYEFWDGGHTMPVKSVTEAIKLLKEIY